MKSKSKLDESYLLFQKWWDDIELNNYEKGVLNKEIIKFNQQLFRLKEKSLRIGVWGKAGVGKSSILNNLANENIFKTGILNGSSKTITSREIKLNQENLKKLEFIDFPGFDICTESIHKEEFIKINDLDLILFVVNGDINRNELESINKIKESGRKLILIFNKTDIWEEKEINRLINNIRKKLSHLQSVPIIKNSNKYQDEEIIYYLSKLINELGDLFLISSTLQVADSLSRKIKQCRFLRRKKEAQALIGKFATIKASGVALNPLIFLDVAGCFFLDTALITELSKTYGLKIKKKCAKNLIKTISINNFFIGATQVSIITSLNLIKKLSLIAVPFTAGFSLLPYGPIAIIQAAFAVRATNLIGKLAAREILNKSNINNLEPFQRIKRIALRGTNLVDTKKIFYDSTTIKDLSIFLP